jgi:hypothetical protein
LTGWWRKKIGPTQNASWIFSTTDKRRGPGREEGEIEMKPGRNLEAVLILLWIFLPIKDNNKKLLSLLEKDLNK